MALAYITCCVDSTYEAITAMTEASRKVTYRTARAHIGKDALVETFPDYDWDGAHNRPGCLTLKRDWHVGYYKSTYLGRPVYYVRHSAIEYIFG